MIKSIVTIIIFILSVSIGNAQKKWSLQECVDYALKNNLTLKRTEQTNLLIEEDVVIAKSNKLPIVSGNASQNYSFGSGFNPITNSRVNTGRRSNNFGINTSIVLFDGFNIKNGLKRAEKNREISQLDLKNEE